MALTLSPEQLAWIEDRIRGGEFSTFDEAVSQLVAERIAERRADEDDDDLDWAKPYIEEGRKDVAEGRVMSLEEHLTFIDDLVKSLNS